MDITLWNEWGNVACYEAMYQGVRSNKSDMLQMSNRFCPLISHDASSTVAVNEKQESCQLCSMLPQ